MENLLEGHNNIMPARTISVTGGSNIFIHFCLLDIRYYSLIHE
jgi:hypothetical protein